MTSTWLCRHRKLLSWVAGSLAVLVAAVAVTGYAMLRHFNNNLHQASLSALIGQQPANPTPQAENILIIGSDDGLPAAAGNLTTGQPDTLMLLHIAGDRKSAEVMSIPRGSRVDVPSCKTSTGKTALMQTQIGNAYAVDAQSADHAALGAACVVKTLEQASGIYIGHFIVASLAGFQSMVAALGGVEQCVPAAFTDPNSGITIPAGCQLLTPAQALAYVRARSGSGAGYTDDLSRIAREQSLFSALFARAQSKLLDPAAIYRFIDAATSSLTIDTGLGGITGLYSLERTLHGLPSGKVTEFTVPNIPRSQTGPAGVQDVRWKQPQANEVFAAIRTDKPVSASLLG